MRCLGWALLRRPRVPALELSGNDGDPDVRSDVTALTPADLHRQRRQAVW
jgi:hypothetical protein